MPSHATGEHLGPDVRAGGCEWTGSNSSRGDARARAPRRRRVVVRGALARARQRRRGGDVSRRLRVSALRRSRIPRCRRDRRRVRTAQSNALCIGRRRRGAQGPRRIGGVFAVVPFGEGGRDGLIISV